MPNRSTVFNNHLVIFLGEFLGTCLFLFMAFGGTQVAHGGEASLSDNPAHRVVQLFYIALVFGMSLIVNVWVFFRISGGLFNPAVTLALALIGSLPFTQAAIIFLAEILGCIAAAALVRALLPGIPVQFGSTLSSGESITKGLFLEMFLTAQLIITIIMLATEKHKATFIAPVGIGLSLFTVMLVGTTFTSAAVNPARAFGPAVVSGSFPGYHWIYWVGPMLGALLSVGFYKLMKHLHYEDVRGDMDQYGLELEREKFSRRSDSSPTHRVQNGGEV
ncbi:aquaporin-like protein [Xylogone sp. PMI_703]|nr:aquaporin-like protein [Xylogone sp. PMI_703]